MFEVEGSLKVFAGNAVKGKAREKPYICRLLRSVMTSSTASVHSQLLAV